MRFCFPLSLRYVIDFTSPRVFLAMIRSVHIYIPFCSHSECSWKLTTALRVLIIPDRPQLVEAVGDA